MNSNKPRNPVNAYGIMSPPPSTRTTMQSRRSRGSSSHLRSQIGTPPSRNQLVTFLPGTALVDSPKPVPAIIKYPTRISQDTQPPDMTDPFVLQQFREYLHQQQREQQYRQYQQQDRDQHYRTPPDSMTYGRGPFPYAQADCGYSTPPRDSANGFGIPNQQPQMPNNIDGHYFGPIEMLDNSKAIFGNVDDGGQSSLYLKRKNHYSSLKTLGNAQFLTADTTHEGMERFFRA